MQMEPDGDSRSAAGSTNLASDVSAARRGATRDNGVVSAGNHRKCANPIDQDMGDEGEIKSKGGRKGKIRLSFAPRGLTKRSKIEKNNKNLKPISTEFVLNTEICIHHYCNPNFPRLELSLCQTIPAFVSPPVSREAGNVSEWR
jgi:hypothetical protein